MSENEANNIFAMKSITIPPTTKKSLLSTCPSFNIYIEQYIFTNFISDNRQQMHKEI